MTSKVATRQPGGRKAAPLGSRYWQLLGAAGASALGDGMVLVAFPLVAVTLTKDPILISGVLVAEQLPWLLFSLPAGAIADRVSRRRLAVQIEILRAVTLAVFAVATIVGQSSLAALYATAFVIGACETAFWAATNSSLPGLIGRDALPRGNGYLLAADTAGEQFVGPAVGGVLYSWYAAAPFLGDAVSFLASAALLIRAIPASSGRNESIKTGLLTDVREGLRWFRANRLMRLLASIIATFAFCQAVVLALLVLYGFRVLHLDKAEYGLFLAVAATGSVVGGLAAGRIHARLGPLWTIVGAGLVAAAGCVLLSRTSMVAMAVGAVAVQALAVCVGNVGTMSLRQSVIPGELLGRVNNVFRMCVWGVMPLGALAGGLAASWVGLPTTFLIAGLLQAGILLAVAGPLASRMAAEPALQSPPVA